MVDAKKGLKLLVIEKNNVLREKIAGIVSRLDSVAAVCQIRDVRSLDRILLDYHAHVVLLDMAQALEHESATLDFLSRNQTYLVVMTEDDGRYEASGAAARINAHETVEKRRIALDIDTILVRAAAARHCA